MATRFRTAFFAYPSGPADFTATIDRAVAAVQASAPKLKLVPWPQMNVFGKHIPDTVRDNIDDIDVLVCDVTQPNMNVYYEIGFAIGRGKTIAPVINVSFNGAERTLRREGTFDNIGYHTYENADGLTNILTNLPNVILLDLYGQPLNSSQPLFILDTFRKTDFRNEIVSSVKESRVFYRSFDPVEIPSFPAVKAVADATASAGIIIPVLAPHIDDAERHNLRAAFVAGLGHGLSRQTLLIERADHQVSNADKPVDYREMVERVRNEAEIRDLVIKFAQASIIAAQSIPSAKPSGEKTPLQQLSLGATAAENEFRTLQEYFVETSEYLRTVRGEVHIVAGRKGSGKTAIFFQVRDTFRRSKKALVTDLKPESHQLSLFREELLKVVGVGALDHTVAAFWYFLVLSEILLSLKDRIDRQSRFDSSSLEAAKEIDSALEKFKISDSGDFTSRLNRLGSIILQDLKALTVGNNPPSPEQLTNIVFRGGIGKIRAVIERFTDFDTQLVFLLDNIDKGWPATGVNEFDVRIVRLLVEALDKIRRDFHAAGRDFMSVVFLRNDIYELLVNETPDRGKSAEVVIDWTDRTKLRQVIYRRLQASAGEKADSFEKLWERFFVPSVGKQGSFEYFLDHCLMRPRFLIQIIDNAIANGINRVHTRVERDDCIDAVKQHSNYLIRDFGYEIRDVSGLSSDILYSLIGVTKLLTKDEVIACFRKAGLEDSQLDEAFRLMLWYGVLGIMGRDDRERFIYDYEYILRRIEAEIRAIGDDVLYVVNPAFHVALSS